MYADCAMCYEILKDRFYFMKKCNGNPALDTDRKDKTRQTERVAHKTKEDTKS